MSAPVSKDSIPIIRSHVALRGIAAMAVLLAHLNAYGMASLFPQDIYKELFYWHGFAVDLFFVLSGFIMCWVYVEQARPIAWRSFYAARAARILPLFYLTLLALIPVEVYSMVRYGLIDVGPTYPYQLASNALLVSGIISGFQGTINQPAWSISVEVCCYMLVFPLLVWLSRRSKSVPLLLPVLICIIATQAVASCYQSSAFFVLGSWDSTWVTRGVFGFISGFFVCRLFQSFQRAGPSCHMVDGSLFILVAIFVLSRLGVVPEVSIIYLFPFAVFMTAFDVGLLARVFKQRPLQWLGERSYSIYLWHYPCFIFYIFLSNHLVFVRSILQVQGGVAGLVKFILVVAQILILAELSYRYFETPFRVWLRRLGRVRKGGPEEWKEFLPKKTE